MNKFKYLIPSADLADYLEDLAKPRDVEIVVTASYYPDEFGSRVDFDYWNFADAERDADLEYAVDAYMSENGEDVARALFEEYFDQD